MVAAVLATWFTAAHRTCSGRQCVLCISHDRKQQTCHSSV